MILPASSFNPVIPQTTDGETQPLRVDVAVHILGAKDQAAVPCGRFIERGSAPPETAAAQNEEATIADALAAWTSRKAEAIRAISA